MADTESKSSSDFGAANSAVWNDPSLEETIDKLEWCYRHREQLQGLARQAAVDMRAFSWSRLAEGLLSIARQTEAMRT